MTATRKPAPQHWTIAYDKAGESTIEVKGSDLLDVLVHLWAVDEVLVALNSDCTPAPYGEGSVNLVESLRVKYFGVPTDCEDDAEWHEHPVVVGIEVCGQALAAEMLDRMDQSESLGLDIAMKSGSFLGVSNYRDIRKALHAAAHERRLRAREVEEKGSIA